MIHSRTIILNLNEYKAKLLLQSVKYARGRLEGKMDDPTRLTMMDLERELEEKIKQS